jgi:hypothetical protein
MKQILSVAGVLFCGATVALALTDLAQPPQGKHKPIPGKASKTYHFAYQSDFDGDGRIYTASNAANDPSTHVLWTDDSAVLLDGYLPRWNGRGKEPTWPTGVQPANKAAKGDTKLAYGLNKDECDEMVDAYRRPRDKCEGEPTKDDGPNNLLKGRLYGTFAIPDENGEDFKEQPIDIEVISQMDAESVRYKVTNNAPKTQLELVDSENEKEGTNQKSLQVCWHLPNPWNSDERALFFSKQQASRTDTGKPMLKKDCLLEIRNPMGKRVAATSVDAYVVEKK